MADLKCYAFASINPFGFGFIAYRIAYVFWVKSQIHGKHVKIWILGPEFFLQSGFENLSSSAFLLSLGIIDRWSLISVITMSLGLGFCASLMLIRWSDHRRSTYHMITIARSRVLISRMCLSPIRLIRSVGRGFFHLRLSLAPCLFPMWFPFIRVFCHF